MNFICEKNKLVEALSNVQKAVSQKSTIAALEGVLISTKENELEICAYNTELGIKTFIPAQIKKGGKIVLNAHLFTDIIRKLPNDLAEIEISENLIAKITSGCSSFELIGIDASEFPSLPNVENADCIELNDTVLPLSHRFILILTECKISEWDETILENINEINNSIRLKFGRTKSITKPKIKRKLSKKATLTARSKKKMNTCISIGFS